MQLAARLLVAVAAGLLGSTHPGEARAAEPTRGTHGATFSFGGAARSALWVYPEVDFFSPRGPEGSTYLGVVYTSPQGVHLSGRVVLSATTSLDSLAFVTGVGATWDLPKRGRLRLEGTFGQAGAPYFGGDVVSGFYPQVGTRLDLLGRFPGGHGSLGGYTRWAANLMLPGALFVLEIGIAAEFGRNGGRGTPASPPSPDPAP